MASKDEERDLLYQAAELCSELRNGSIQDCESPDFVICRPNLSIGLEVTRYVRKDVLGDKPGRGREAAIQRLCTAALKLCAQYSEAKIYVAPQWVESYHPHKQEVSRTAERLVNIVLDHLPIMINSGCTISSTELQDNKLTDVVTSIYVMRLFADSYSSWSSGVSGSSTVTPQELQAIIDVKNAKFVAYNAEKKFDQLWLLIIADGRSVSSYAAIRTDIWEHAYQHDFNRLFFVSIGDRSWVELKNLNALNR